MLPLIGDIKQEGYREGPPYQRRGSLQLWQFLVALLDDPSNSHFIAWTGRGMEFKLIEPEEVRFSVTFFFKLKTILYYTSWIVDYRNLVKTISDLGILSMTGTVLLKLSNYTVMKKE